MVLVPIAAAVVGYYFGRADRSNAVWTDRESTLSGTGPWISTLRCTYHLADGTTRRIESATVVATIGAIDSADRRSCPAAP
jgi:hypothetical protein